MTIDVKIINILQATFSYDSVEHTFYVLTAVIFGESYNKKVAGKMLGKLSTGFNQI